jgi:hypothetical protein
LQLVSVEGNRMLSFQGNRIHSMQLHLKLCYFS